MPPGRGSVKRGTASRGTGVRRGWGGAKRRTAARAGPTSVHSLAHQGGLGVNHVESQVHVRRRVATKIQSAGGAPASQPGNHVTGTRS